MRRLALVALAATGALPGVALAQSGSYFDRTNISGVLDRPRPDYQALGIDVGAFQVFPSLTVAPEYDDNIYATTDQRAGDFVTNITPAVQAHTNWSRHELDAFADVSTNVYADHSTEDTTDYSVGGSGRLDILTQSDLTAGFSVGRNTQPRTSEDTIGSAKSPVQYDQATANVGALQTLNRLQFTEGFTFQRITYSNTTDFAGNVLPLTEFDGDVYQASGRADYALNPEIALFVSAQVNDRPYDEQPPQASLDRNSSGYETTVGADFDITRLARGQLQVGYLSQNYQSHAFRTVSGPAVHASVAYYLSGLTTLTFTADRRIIDALDPVAVSFLQTRGGVQVDQELLRNVILSGRVSYETDAFTGEDRDDDRTSASGSVTYLINRHLGLTGEYSFLNQDSSGRDRVGDYVVNVVSLSLVAQF